MRTPLVGLELQPAPNMSSAAILCTACLKLRSKESLNLQCLLSALAERENDTWHLAGVVGILGSTYTGEFEDIKGLDKLVEKINKKHNWQLGVHVDGASGGFVAPFVYVSKPYHPTLTQTFGRLCYASNFARSIHSMK